MQTRADSIVTIESRHSNKALPIFEAWANSSHVVLVYPDCVVSGMTLKLGVVSEGVYSSSINGTLHPVRGYWYFYIPRSKMVAGDMVYKIISFDELNSRHVMGEGKIRVRRSMVHDATDSDGGEEAIDNAYIQHDGRWYAIRVRYDDSGTPAFAVDSLIEAPKNASGTPYAYNRTTGLYHAIKTEMDEAGSLMLTIESNGVDGEGSFAVGEDGFYHRIETSTDESGSLMLEVGEKQ